MKTVLVATIGTRDLMLQISSGLWYNIGDDRMRDGDIIGEQAEVLSDLGLSTTTYRDLTQYLLEQIEQYRDRLKPIILGKLLDEKATDIEKIYLIGTNQNSEVSEREKDTLYTCKLIGAWLEYNHQISVEIIYIGTEGTNPSNFEQMFRWWQQTWRKTILVKPERPIWICLKGGVGQASEALRISGLSLYGERVQFFEFKQNTKANRRGIPSDYSGPFPGTNYLWDRTQQQALRLLDRYDYAGAYDLLKPYFQQDPAGFSAVPILVKAGTAWNQGEFETFFKLAKNSLNTSEQKRDNTWWWMAYEQAQLGVIRLQQKNTVEAMLHSFRAVEGLLWEWAIETFPNDVKAQSDQYPLLLPSILQKYPSLRDSYNHQKLQQTSKVYLRGRLLQELLEAAIPGIVNGNDFRVFWKAARDKRNELSHRLGGLSEEKVFKAWGQDIHNSNQWETRIFKCLNLVTEQNFKSLSQASLFKKIHFMVVKVIASYQP